MKKLGLYIAVLWLAGFTVAQAQGPAGVDTASLQIWLDANKQVYLDANASIAAITNDDRINVWKDCSRHQFVFKANSDDTRPTLRTQVAMLNNQRGIRFHISASPTDYRNILFMDTFPQGNDISLFVVLRPSVAGGGDNASPVSANGANSSLWYYGAGIVDADGPGLINDFGFTLCDTSLAVGSGNSAITTDYTVKTPLSLGQPYIAYVERNSTSGYLSVSQNGNTSAQMSATLNPVNQYNKLFVGGRSGFTPFNSNYFDGYIAQVLFYSRTLNQAEQNILSNYLSAKYAIPLASNDLYSFDNAPSGDYDFELAGIGKALDGSAQLTAKGESVVQINNAIDLQNGEYLLWAHNGLSLSNEIETDNPAEVRYRLERTWRCAQAGGNTGKVDLVLDYSGLNFSDPEKIVLLIDQDNNGSFLNEVKGFGFLNPTQQLSGNRLQFSGVTLPDGARFTFASLKGRCPDDCDEIITPNGDGVTDYAYIFGSGTAKVYDKQGFLVKTITLPEVWDATNEQGALVAPGFYLIVINERIKRKVTVIR